MHHTTDFYEPTPFKVSTMTTLVAQIAPQRSTQYTELVTQLAPYELALSPIGSHILNDISTVALGSHDYLKFELDTELTDTLLQAFNDLAMTDAYFLYYEHIGSIDGPFLKPVDVPVRQFLPKSLVATRRYRGKTNELLTQMMCNVARHASDFRSTLWHKLTLLDPLSGGGTTLFVGLMLGADVAGVEKDKKVVEGTVGFLKQYLKEAQLPADFRVDRLKNIGKRWFISLNKSARCVIAHGDTTQVEHFVNGLKGPQLIVTDLPYGIQHHAEWKSLLVSAIPAWSDVLAEGGALVFSWNATKFPRNDMIQLVHDVSDFTVLNDPPYNQLAHRVDRVIKQRDIVVARR